MGYGGTPKYRVGEITGQNGLQIYANLIKCVLVKRLKIYALNQAILLQLKGVVSSKA